jgi:signal transduction histidine kinase
MLSCRADRRAILQLRSAQMTAAEVPLAGAPPTAARVRHDLLTPINGIIGYAGILLEDAADLGRDEMRGPLEEIRSGARGIADVIRRALEPHLDESTLGPAIDSVRETCLGPARGLAASAGWLLAEVAPPHQAALTHDLEQLAASARSLAALLDRSAEPMESDASSR